MRLFESCGLGGVSLSRIRKVGAPRKVSEIVSTTYADSQIVSDVVSRKNALADGVSK